MLVGLNEILRNADERGYAVPTFNVYNMKTVIGIIGVAEECHKWVVSK